jgi:DNA helicase-2/ATP-dependent DNA helicase PcrA
MDAVFADDDGGYTVVDWKTGPPPTGEDSEANAVQLAIYRLAWARLRCVDNLKIDSVRAVFHYVAHNKTIRPSKLMSGDELRQMLHAGAGR